MGTVPRRTSIERELVQDFPQETTHDRTVCYSNDTYRTGSLHGRDRGSNEPSRRDRPSRERPVRTETPPYGNRIRKHMTTHIKLHGTKADRFEEVKRELSERMGYELSNSETLGLLMAGIDSEDLTRRRL